MKFNELIKQPFEMWFAGDFTGSDESEAVLQELQKRINNRTHWILGDVPNDHSLLVELKRRYYAQGGLETYYIKICPRHQPVGMEFVIYMAEKARLSAMRLAAAMRQQGIPMTAHQLRQSDIFCNFDGSEDSEIAQLIQLLSDGLKSQVVATPDALQRAEGVYPVRWVRMEDLLDREPDDLDIMIGICGYSRRGFTFRIPNDLKSWVGIKRVAVSKEAEMLRCNRAETCLDFDCNLNRATDQSLLKIMDADDIAQINSTGRRMDFNKKPDGSLHDFSDVFTSTSTVSSAVGLLKGNEFCLLVGQKLQSEDHWILIADAAHNYLATVIEETYYELASEDFEAIMQVQPGLGILTVYFVHKRRMDARRLHDLLCAHWPGFTDEYLTVEELEQTAVLPLANQVDGVMAWFRATTGL